MAFNWMNYDFKSNQNFAVEKILFKNLVNNIQKIMFNMFLSDIASIIILQFI